MKVLMLGTRLSPIEEIIACDGTEVMEWSEPVDVHFLEKKNFGFVVSYGYRHLITKPVLDYLPEQIINLHISYLPWNRGADPNLWSFLEDTPKGVSIHVIDNGTDTGDIIVQKEIEFLNDDETLSTTYKTLQDELIMLFRKEWKIIRDGSYKKWKQCPGGSFHKSVDKERYAHLLINGWDTPVSSLRGKALPVTH